MTGTVDMPPWLQAWHERRDQPQQAAAPRAQPQSQGGQGFTGGKGRKAATAEATRPARPKVNYQGFVEPVRWAYDGGVRREPVLDCDYHPPRVVRKVGWRNCMACGQPFFSEDLIALRLCDGLDGCRDQAPKRYKFKTSPFDASR